MSAVTVLEHKPDNVIVHDAASLMGAIARLSSDSTVDVDKLERLLAAYNKLKENEQRVAYHAALAAAKRKIGPVVRDKVNEQTKSKYASLEKIAEAIDPIISEHDLVFSFAPGECPIEGSYRVTCRIKCGGYVDPPEEKPPFFADIPIDAGGIRGNTNKTPTHAWGSTQTYGRRYLKCMLLDISLKNDDDDGNGGPGKFITPTQAKEITAAIDEIGMPVDLFLNHMGAPTVAEIPAAKLQRALQAIGATKRVRAARERGDLK